jgi:chromate reductase
METIKILGFGGSLREGSYNWALLENAKEMMPEGSELTLYDLKDIPVYNQDLDENLPDSVKKFKEAVRNADGILISTPEYNFSIPGFLKNALDFASRPPSDNPFPGKPVAIMSASGSMLGGARVQYHLRQVLGYLDMKQIYKPEVFLTFAHTKFDQNMKLTDDGAREFIKQLLAKLVNEARANLK